MGRMLSFNASHDMVDITLTTLSSTSVRHLGLGFLLLVCCSCSNQVQDTEIVGTPHIIDTSQVDSELAETIGDTLGLIAQTPYSASLRGRLGMIYEVNHFPDAARIMYQQASALDEREFAWWYFGALIDQQKGDIDQALEKIARAIDIDHGYVPAHLHRGNWLLQQDLLAEAMEAFSDAAALGAGSPAAVGTAQVHLRREEFNKVVDNLVPYAETLPHPQIWRLLSTAYTRLGMEEEAEVARALSRDASPMLWLDPLRQRPNRYVRGFGRRMVYAQSLLKADRYDDALRELESLQGIKPNDEALISNLAFAYEKTQQAEKAKDILQKGIELMPKQFRFYVQLGDLMYRGGHNEDALMLLTQSTEISDRNPGAYERLGSVLMRLERFDEAISAFMKAIEFGYSDTAGIRLRIGTIYGYREQWTEAIAEFSQVVELDPGNENGHVYLAHALVEQGELDQAEAALNWAYRLGVDPELLQPPELLIEQRRNQVNPTTP